MSIRNVSFSLGEYYHIYNRGNSKQKIFHDKEDHKRFVDLLYAINRDEKFNFADSLKGISVYELDGSNKLVSIGAYVLMPNHFHILLTENIEGGISRFMQKLSTAYAMYYNKKYDRTGSLFEGKFKAQHLNTDRYLKYIYSYIHLNPIKLIDKEWKERGIRNKKRAIEYLREYEYSSYLDHMSFPRIQNKILDRKIFPAYFANTQEFVKDIMDWINYREDIETL